MKIRYLLYFSILLFFKAPEELVCAETKSDFETGKEVVIPYDMTGAQGVNSSLITITNSSGRDLWVSVKVGGQFTGNTDPISGEYTLFRKSKGTVLLSDPLIPSGQSVMFDKHSFQHLTLRIFETKDDYKNYQNSKIGIIYSPVNLAGLKEIIIDFDAESGYRKIDRRYFVGIECILCLGLINDGEIVAIANPCAHKLHRKCIEAWIGGATNASERIERQSHCISCNTHIIRYVYRNATTGALVE